MSVCRPLFTFKWICAREKGTMKGTEYVVLSAVYHIAWLYIVYTYNQNPDTNFIGVGCLILHVRYFCLFFLVLG